MIDPLRLLTRFAKFLGSTASKPFRSFSHRGSTACAEHEQEEQPQPGRVLQALQGLVRDVHLEGWQMVGDALMASCKMFINVCDMVRKSLMITYYGILVAEKNGDQERTQEGPREVSRLGHVGGFLRLLKGFFEAVLLVPIFVILCPLFLLWVYCYTLFDKETSTNEEKEEAQWGVHEWVAFFRGATAWLAGASEGIYEEFLEWYEECKERATGDLSEGQLHMLTTPC